MPTMKPHPALSHSTSFQDANGDMTALLQQFLITSSNAFKSSSAGLTQESAAERLAQTLKHFGVGEDAAMSIVYALLNTLYEHNKLTTDEQSVVVQENVIIAISKIACIYKSDKVCLQI